MREWVLLNRDLGLSGRMRLGPSLGKVGERLWVSRR